MLYYGYIIYEYYGGTFWTWFNEDGLETVTQEYGETIYCYNNKTINLSMVIFLC